MSVETPEHLRRIRARLSFDSDKIMSAVAVNPQTDSVLVEGAHNEDDDG